MKKSPYFYTSLFAWGIVLFLIVFYAFAWNPPTDNPPNANLPAPINTSSIEQTKLGNLNLDNNLKVGGLLRVGLYTSHPTGTNGNLYYNTADNKFYGYQNGSWSELGGGGSVITSVFGRTGAVIAQSGDYTVSQITGAAPLDSPTFTGTVTMPGTGIWNSSGNVGIGTTSPAEKLEVSGNIKLSGASPAYKVTNLATPTASSDAATKGYVDAQTSLWSDCYAVCQSTLSPSCGNSAYTIRSNYCIANSRNCAYRSLFPIYLGSTKIVNAGTPCCWDYNTRGTNWYYYKTVNDPSDTILFAQVMSGWKVNQGPSWQNCPALNLPICTNAQKAGVNFATGCITCCKSD